MPSTVWRGFLSFGLISLPVRLFRAARAERVPLRKVARIAKPVKHLETLETPALARVYQRVHHHAVTAAGVALEPKQVVKAFEVENDKFVALPQEEIQALRSETSTKLVIGEFVSLDEVDPLFYESSYYVTPEEAGEKAYALLYLALKAKSIGAIGEIAMHGRDHTMLVRPGKSGLLAHTLFYLNEVHSHEEFIADPSLIQPKELELAGELVTSLIAPFDPANYRDAYRHRLEELIASKQKPAAKQKVIDIGRALEDSLKNLKKPAAKAAAPGRRNTSKAL